MALLFILFICLLALFFKSPSKCVLLIVIAQPTLSLFKIGGLGYSLDSIFSLIIFAYLIVNHKKYIDNKNRLPFIAGLSISFISYLVTGLYSGTNKLPIVLWLNCYDYILVICLWYLFIPNKSNKKFLFTTLFIYMGILTIYGIQESITTENPFIQYMINTGQITAIQRDDYVRFGLYRAQSLTRWMESFGTVCVFALLFMLNCAFKGIIKFKIRVYIMAILLTVSIFVTGSRTMIAMLAMATLSLVPYFYKRTKYVMMFAILIIVFVYNNPDYISDLATSFTDTASAGGSSINGREWQFLSALSFYYNSPIFGNGINFIDEALNQSSGLMGGESIIFKTLVDRGNIGMITLIFLYLNVIYVLCKKRQFSMIFLVLSYMFGKIATLIYGHSEVYVLFWIVMLLKLYDVHSEKTRTRISDSVHNNCIKNKY